MSWLRCLPALAQLGIARPANAPNLDRPDPHAVRCRTGGHRVRPTNLGCAQICAQSAISGIFCSLRRGQMSGNALNLLIFLARSERFELPTLGIEIRCSIQLSYERVRSADYQTWFGRASQQQKKPSSRGAGGGPDRYRRRRPGGRGRWRGHHNRRRCQAAGRGRNCAGS